MKGENVEARSVDSSFQLSVEEGLAEDMEESYSVRLFGTDF